MLKVLGDTRGDLGSGRDVLQIWATPGRENKVWQALETSDS